MIRLFYASTSTVTLLAWIGLIPLLMVVIYAIGQAVHFAQLIEILIAISWIITTLLWAIGARHLSKDRLWGLCYLLFSAVIFITGMPIARFVTKAYTQTRRMEISEAFLGEFISSFEEHHPELKSHRLSIAYVEADDHWKPVADEIARRFKERYGAQGSGSPEKKHKVIYSCLWNSFRGITPSVLKFLRLYDFLMRLWHFTNAHLLWEAGQIGNR